MPRYTHDAEEMTKNKSRARFALVEMPPLGDLGVSTEPCLRGTLSDVKEWILEVPVKVQMKDGRVLTVETPESEQSPPTSP
jgi:hypothetical protein